MLRILNNTNELIFQDLFICLESGTNNTFVIEELRLI